LWMIRQPSCNTLPPAVALKPRDGREIKNLCSALPKWVFNSFNHFNRVR
jgi:hypothetical protein